MAFGGAMVRKEYVIMASGIGNLVDSCMSDTGSIATVYMNLSANEEEY